MCTQWTQCSSTHIISYTQTHAHRQAYNYVLCTPLFRLTHVHTYPKRILVEIWWLSFNHFNGHYTQRPYVHFWSILLSCHHFWCHPVRGTHHSGALTLLWSYLGTEPKISYRQLSSIKEER